MTEDTRLLQDHVRYSKEPHYSIVFGPQSAAKDETLTEKNPSRDVYWVLFSSVSTLLGYLLRIMALNLNCLPTVFRSTSINDVVYK